MKVPSPIPGMTYAETVEVYMNAIKNGNISISIRCYSKTLLSGIVLTDDDLVLGQGITITDIINPDDDLVYGKAVSKEAIIHIIKSSKTDDIDWSREIKIYGNIDYNGTSYGTAIYTIYGNEPAKRTENGLDILEYVGYTGMCLYDYLADDFGSSLTFPMTLSQFVSQLATHLNTNIYLGTSVNTYATITDNPFSGQYTYRQIFAWIAEFTGTYCVEEGTIGLRFKSFSDLDYGIDYTLTPDEYFSITKSDYEIASLPAVQYINTTDNSKSASYPSTYTGVPYQIVDNPIFDKLQSTAQVETCLQNILENKLTFGDSDPTKKRYIPMKIEAIGNFLLEAGDIINIEDLEGNILPLRIFSKVFKWDGSCRDVYECTGSAVRQLTTEYTKESIQVNNIVSNRIVDSLNFSTKGMALDASQGQILSNSIGVVQGEVTALSDKVDVIGTKKSNSSSGTINCSENTKSAGCSITITPGTWIVCANATIYKCVSGKRQGLTVTSNSAAGQYNRYCYELRNSPASTTANQYYNVSRVWTVSANTTLYVMLYNGNVSTAYEASIDAVRIL